MRYSWKALLTEISNTNLNRRYYHYFGCKLIMYASIFWTMRSTASIDLLYKFVMLRCSISTRLLFFLKNCFTDWIGSYPVNVDRMLLSLHTTAIKFEETLVTTSGVTWRYFEETWVTTSDVTWLYLPNFFNDACSICLALTFPVLAIWFKLKCRSKAGKKLFITIW